MATKKNSTPAQTGKTAVSKDIKKTPLKASSPSKTVTKKVPEKKSGKPIKNSSPVKTVPAQAAKSSPAKSVKTVASKKAISAPPVKKSKGSTPETPSEKSVPASIVAKAPKSPISTRVEPATHGALYVRSGRHFFTEDRAILDMPELISAQLDSYRNYLEKGVREALESIFPISDFSEERVEIHFKGMELENPRYTAKECRRKNLNYESYLRVKLQLLNKETGEIKEDTVFMGGIPLMTDRGTFIINGVERIVVHQIIKADGIAFEVDG